MTNDCEQKCAEPTIQPDTIQSLKRELRWNLKQLDETRYKLNELSTTHSETVETYVDTICYLKTKLKSCEESYRFAVRRNEEYRDAFDDIYKALKICDKISKLKETVKEILNRF